jgi:lipopolysaccharide export system permease protein
LARPAQKVSGMKTVRSLLYRDIGVSVAFVAVAFLSLFFFVDFVDELEGVGQRGRTVAHAALAALYELPGHLYELVPIAVLIGGIYSLSRMAQSSEFTILRTGGLGPGRALGLLAVLGIVFGVLTLIVGDFVAPAAERQGVLLKARFSGKLDIGGAGAWLKEKRNGAEGERSVSVNVGGTGPGGSLLAVRIFEFDRDGALVARIEAREARVGSDGVWTLLQAERSLWPSPLDSGRAQVQASRHDTLDWPSSLDARVVAAAVSPVGTMSTLELWRYGVHLSDQEQASQATQIRFWRKALYPLSCLVMVALALPFAYLHARAGGVSLKVFGGIMLGISFVLLNNLSGHIGNLQGWTPWVAAAVPSLVYLLLSMAAFTWLVRYR